MSDQSKSSLPPRPAKGPTDGSHQPLNMVVFENGPGLCPALLFLTSGDGDLIGSLDAGGGFHEQRELGMSS